MFFVGVIGGISLLSDGLRIAIATRSGYVRVYELINDLWSKVGEVMESEDPSGGFGYGITVSMSSNGSKVALGASYHNNFSEHVRILQDDSFSFVPTPTPTTYTHYNDTSYSSNTSNTSNTYPPTSPVD